LTLSFRVRGRPAVAENDEPSTQIVAATPEFFNTIGIPVQRGRLYTSDAQPGTPKEVVVSRELVRRYFPNEDPLGQYIDLGWSENGDRRGGTIIGVVGDVKQGALDQETPPMLYLPYVQAPIASLRIVLLTSLPPASLTRPVHAA